MIVWFKGAFPQAIPAEQGKFTVWQQRCSKKGMSRASSIFLCVPPNTTIKWLHNKSDRVGSWINPLQFLLLGGPLQLFTLTFICLISMVAEHSKFHLFNTFSNTLLASISNLITYKFWSLYSIVFDKLSVFFLSDIDITMFFLISKFALIYFPHVLWLDDNTLFIHHLMQSLSVLWEFFISKPEFD